MSKLVSCILHISFKICVQCKLYMVDNSKLETDFNSYHFPVSLAHICHIFLLNFLIRAIGSDFHISSSSAIGIVEL